MCAIGIAPWGIIENKEDLIGRDVRQTHGDIQYTDRKTPTLTFIHFRQIYQVYLQYKCKSLDDGCNDDFPKIIRETVGL